MERVSDLARQHPPENMNEWPRISEESGRWRSKRQCRFAASITETHVAWLCLCQLAKRTDNNDLKTIQNDFQDFFKAFAQPRHSAQHIDERLADTLVSAIGNILFDGSHLYIEVASDVHTIQSPDPTSHVATVAHPTNPAKIQQIRTTVDLGLSYLLTMRAFEARLCDVLHREFQHCPPLNSWNRFPSPAAAP